VSPEEEARAAAALEKVLARNVFEFELPEGAFLQTASGVVVRHLGAGRFECVGAPVVLLEGATYGDEEHAAWPQSLPLELGTKARGSYRRRVCTMEITDEAQELMKAILEAPDAGA
jgi:hypothetical protein